MRACVLPAALAMAGVQSVVAQPGCLPQWDAEFSIGALNGRVFAMTVFDDGTGAALYAAGEFTAAGGQAASHVARWDGAEWSALGAGTNEVVVTLAVYDDGDGPALYAGGMFSEAGGQPVNYIASWDGQTWSEVGGGMNVYGYVRTLAVFDDGSGPELYAGGHFQSAGDSPTSFIARWDGLGWSAAGSGTNDLVYALHVFDDGAGPDLYAGGFFSVAGGVTARRIARWDGAAWTGLGHLSGGANPAVYAIDTFDSGTGPALIAAGTFTTAGGKPVSNIARWDGVAWSALGTGLDSQAVALHVFDDGAGPALFVGGRFTHAGGQPANRIARWSGQAWDALGSGTDNAVMALASFDGGLYGGPDPRPSLFLGGGFSSIGGVPGRYIARWGCPLTHATLERASISAYEAPPEGDSSGGSVALGGGLVAFQSTAANLVANDSNNTSDIFVRNFPAGWTSRVSLTHAGYQSNGPSHSARISAKNGQFVAFVSGATNLVPGDTNHAADVFIRDRFENQTARLSISTAGAQANGPSDQPQVSPDGRFVVFRSTASNLVPGDTNGVADIFLRDRFLDTTVRVSVTSAGVQANGASSVPSVSDNGRLVAFASDAGNLVASDTNGRRDVFLRDLPASLTTRESITAYGHQANGHSFGPCISGNGGFIAFTSAANNLLSDSYDWNSANDVFVRVRGYATTVRASVGTGGQEAIGPSTVAAISANGRHVLFNSEAANLVPDDFNGCGDVFIRDRWEQITRRVSVGDAGQESDSPSAGTAISPDGIAVVFTSDADNLVPGDSGWSDVFLRLPAEP